MSRSRNLDCMTRYQWFESGFLQQRVSITAAGKRTQQRLHQPPASRASPSMQTFRPALIRLATGPHREGEESRESHAI